MKKQNLQKTNIPLLFGIENNGDRLWWKYLKNPTLPLLQMRTERGGGGTFELEKTEFSWADRTYLPQFSDQKLEREKRQSDI